MTRDLQLHLNSVRRELNNLESVGIIRSHTKEDLEKEVEKKLKDNKKYYKLDSNFIFIDELKSLLIKAQLVLEKSLSSKIDKVGSVSFFLMSGVFVGREDAPADLLIVGQINRRRLISLIKSFERDLGQPIRYSVLTRGDFQYRRDVTDKFIYDLLEGKNLILIDKLTPNIK